MCRRAHTGDSGQGHYTLTVYAFSTTGHTRGIGDASTRRAPRGPECQCVGVGTGSSAETVSRRRRGHERGRGRRTGRHGRHAHGDLTVKHASHTRCPPVPPARHSGCAVRCSDNGKKFPHRPKLVSTIRRGVSIHAKRFITSGSYAHQTYIIYLGFDRCCLRHRRRKIRAYTARLPRAARRAGPRLEASSGAILRFLPDYLSCNPATAACTPGQHWCRGAISVGGRSDYPVLLTESGDIWTRALEPS